MDSMSLKTRYIYFKKNYMEYCCLFILKNQKISSCELDLELLNLLKEKDIQKFLNQSHINYLIVDNLKIIQKKEFCDNQYHKFIYFMETKKIIKRILKKCTKKEKIHVQNCT